MADLNVDIVTNVRSLHLSNSTGDLQEEVGSPRQQFRQYFEEYQETPEPTLAEWPGIDNNEEEPAEVLIPVPLFSSERTMHSASAPTSIQTLPSARYMAPARPVSPVRLLPANQRTSATQQVEPQRRDRRGRPARRPVSSSLDLDYEVPPTPITEAKLNIAIGTEKEVCTRECRSSNIVKHSPQRGHSARKPSQEWRAISERFVLTTKPPSPCFSPNGLMNLMSGEGQFGSQSVSEQPSSVSNGTLRPPLVGRPRANSSNDIFTEHDARPNPWAQRPIAPDPLNDYPPTISPFKTCEEKTLLPGIRRQPLSVRRQKFAEGFETITRSSSRASSQASESRVPDQRPDNVKIELPGSTTFAKDSNLKTPKSSEPKAKITTLDLYLRSPTAVGGDYYFSCVTAEQLRKDFPISPPSSHSGSFSSINSISELDSECSTQSPRSASEIPAVELASTPEPSRGRQYVRENSLRRDRSKHMARYFGLNAGETPPPPPPPSPLCATVFPSIASVTSPQLMPSKPHLPPCGDILTPPVTPPQSSKPKLQLETAHTLAHLEGTPCPPRLRARSADPVIERGQPATGDCKEVYSAIAPPPPTSLHPAFAHRNHRVPVGSTDDDASDDWETREKRRQEWLAARRAERKKEDEACKAEWAAALAAYKEEKRQRLEQPRMAPYGEQEFLQHYQPHAASVGVSIVGGELAGPGRIAEEWHERERGRKKPKNNVKVARLKATAFGAGAAKLVRLL